MGKANEIHLNEEERNQLESWVHKATTEQHFVERARIVLASTLVAPQQICGHGLPHLPLYLSRTHTPLQFAETLLSGTS